MPEKSKVVSHVPAHSIKVRLIADQLQTVRVAAALKGLRTSEYLRQAGLEAAKSTIEASIRKLHQQ